MALMAVLPGLFPSALVRDTAAAPAREAATVMPRLEDAVVFSSAPFRLLADLATAGLRQLATLLPSLERASEDGSLVPLGHLAKAANTAAREVADGHLALLAAGPDRTASALLGVPIRTTPSDGLRALARQRGGFPVEAAPPRAADDLRAIARQLGAALPLVGDDAPAVDPKEGWLAEAKHILRRTGDALADAVDRYPATDTTIQLSPQTSWAMAEIVAARAQVSATLVRLNEIPTEPNRRATAPLLAGPFGLEQWAGATGALGIVLLLALLVLIGGAWSLGAAILALGGTAYGAWRIGRASRGFRLDAPP